MERVMSTVASSCLDPNKYKHLCKIVKKKMELFIENKIEFDNENLVLVACCVGDGQDVEVYFVNNESFNPEKHSFEYLNRKKKFESLHSHMSLRMSPTIKLGEDYFPVKALLQNQLREFKHEEGLLLIMLQSQYESDLVPLYKYLFKKLAKTFKVPDLKVVNIYGYEHDKKQEDNEQEDIYHWNDSDFNFYSQIYQVRRYPHFIW